MAHINRKTRSITFTVIKFLGSLNRLNQTSLGHYGSLSPQFLTHFIFLYASPIWIQKKRSTYFAGWFVSARYLTFSLTNSGPHRIVTCIGIASLLTSQQISRISGFAPGLSEIEIFLLKFRRNVMQCWICGFIVTFEWHLIVFKLL